MTHPTTTAPAAATGMPELTTPNPTKPVAITVIGLVIGVLCMVQAYFTSGHIPSAAEVSGLLAGAGITATSVGGFLAHHLGVNKAMLARDAAVVNAVTAPPPPTAPVGG